MLLGTEVKAIREGRVNLRDSYAQRRGRRGVPATTSTSARTATAATPTTSRCARRKLLLHRHEIRKLIGKTVEKGMTLVPVRMYFKNGRVKVAVSLAKGKKEYDKRETIKRRETDRETRAAVKERRADWPLAFEVAIRAVLTARRHCPSCGRGHGPDVRAGAAPADRSARQSSRPCGAARRMLALVRSRSRGRTETGDLGRHVATAASVPVRVPAVGVVDPRTLDIEPEAMGHRRQRRDLNAGLSAARRCSSRLARRRSSIRSRTPSERAQDSGDVDLSAVAGEGIGDVAASRSRQPASARRACDGAPAGAAVLRQRAGHHHALVGTSGMARLRRPSVQGAPLDLDGGARAIPAHLASEPVRPRCREHRTPQISYPAATVPSAAVIAAIARPLAWRRVPTFPTPSAAGAAPPLPSYGELTGAAAEAVLPSPPRRGHRMTVRRQPARGAARRRRRRADSHPATLVRSSTPISTGAAVKP